MRKDRKEERRKEIRSLYARQRELHEIKWNNCWVEYEDPEPHGWYIRMVLRDDIAKREDADVFLKVIELLERKCWDKEKRLSYKSKTYSRGRKWETREHIPWSQYDYKHNSGYGVSYKKWKTLEPKVQKHFSAPVFKNQFDGGWCMCVVPDYYWDRKLERCYATHYQVVDTDIEQELAWIDNRIWGEYYCEPYADGWYYKTPKWHRRDGNRRNRHNAKNEIRKMSQGGYSDESVDRSDFSKGKYDGWW